MQSSGPYGNAVLGDTFYKATKDRHDLLQSAKVNIGSITHPAELAMTRL